MTKTSSAQLERQAEQKRAQIAETLDELRSRMTPGEIVDQLYDYVSEGSGGAFLRNLRAQCVANPVPVTFVGAGLAWLVLSGLREPRQHRSSVRSAARDRSNAPSGAVSRAKSRLSAASDDVSRSAMEVGDQTRRTAGEFGERIKQEASGLSESAGAYADDVRHTARDLRDSVSGAAKSGYQKAEAGYDRMAESVSDAYDSATEQAHEAMETINRAAPKVRDSVAGVGNGLVQVLREQPLVLAGFGLAIGGLLGAFLPTTELEDRVMGDASDKLKDKIRDKAGETLDKGQAVADRAWQEAREEAEDQGLLPLNRAASENGGKSKLKNEPEASLVPQAEGGEQVPGGA